MGLGRFTNRPNRTTEGEIMENDALRMTAELFSTTSAFPLRIRRIARLTWQTCSGS